MSGLEPRWYYDEIIAKCGGYDEFIRKCYELYYCDNEEDILELGHS